LIVAVNFTISKCIFFPSLDDEKIEDLDTNDLKRVDISNLNHNIEIELTTTTEDGILIYF